MAGNKATPDVPITREHVELALEWIEERDEQRAKRTAPARGDVTVDVLGEAMLGIARAKAVVCVLGRLFGGEYEKAVRPADDEIFLSLDVAVEVMKETAHRLCDAKGIEGIRAGASCGRAAAMLSVLAAMGWSDQYEITLADDVLSNYFGAIEATLDKCEEEVDSLEHSLMELH